MPTAKVLTLDGEIDCHLSPEVAASLRAIVANKPKRVVVDLSKVTYLDSSGLAVLIDGMQNTEDYGGKIFLPAKEGKFRPAFLNAFLGHVVQAFSPPDTAL